MAFSSTESVRGRPVMAPDHPCNHWLFSVFWQSTPVLTHGSLTGKPRPKGRPVPQRARQRRSPPSRALSACVAIPARPARAAGCWPVPRRQRYAVTIYLSPCGHKGHLLLSIAAPYRHTPVTESAACSTR